MLIIDTESHSLSLPIVKIDSSKVTYSFVLKYHNFYFVLPVHIIDDAISPLLFVSSARRLRHCYLDSFHLQRRSRTTLPLQLHLRLQSIHRAMSLLVSSVVRGLQLVSEQHMPALRHLSRQLQDPVDATSSTVLSTTPRPEFQSMLHAWSWLLVGKTEEWNIVIGECSSSSQSDLGQQWVHSHGWRTDTRAQSICCTKSLANQSNCPQWNLPDRCRFQ